MDDLFNLILTGVGKINPLFAVALLGVWMIFGDRIKGVLSRFPLLGPLLKPAPVPSPAPDAPKVDPDSDLDKWLEDHTLLDRLWKRLKGRFGDAVTKGDLDEDEAYEKLLKAIKAALDEPKK